MFFLVKKVASKLDSAANDHKYIFAVMLFSTGIALHTLLTVLIKSIGVKTECSTYEILFLRGFFAFLILTPFFLTKKVKFITKQQFIPNLIVALFSICATYCWHYGLSMVPVNNGIIINFLLPMTTSVVAYFLIKEKLSKELIISIIICFLTIFFAYGFASSLSIGYFLLACDILSYSLYVVLSKKLILQKQSPVSLLYFKVIIICITSIHVIPDLYNKVSINYGILTSTFVATLFYVLEALLVLKAYTYTAVSSLQPLYYTRIIFASIFSYLLLGEMFTFKQLITASIIILVNLNLIRIFRKSSAFK